MKTLYIDKYQYLLPESMNEMTVPQLIHLSTLVQSELPIQEIKVKMLFVCLRAHVKRMKNEGYYRISIGKHLFALTVADIANASTAFDYLFTAPNDKGQCFLDNRLTVNPFPTMRLLGRNYLSPSDNLTSITYNQYIYLETYHSVMNNKPEALYAFLACMFTPRGTTFNPEALDTKRMKMLSPSKVILMCWWYIGCIRFIADKFPRIFPADGDSSSNPSSVYDGQMRLLDFIAKADPTKKRLIREDKLYDVLYSLDYLIEQQEAQPMPE